nr:CBS domain-containing protein [Panacagrimonas sp.]
MTRSLVTVTDDETVENAMHAMTDNGISSVVVEADADGEWGIVTRRDIISRILNARKSTSTTKVKEIATRPIVSVPVETNIREAAKLLSEKNFSRLTVQQGGRIIGIVTETDIFNAVEKFGFLAD